VYRRVSCPFRAAREGTGPRKKGKRGLDQRGYGEREFLRIGFVERRGSGKVFPSASPAERRNGLAYPSTSRRGKRANTRKEGRQNLEGRSNVDQRGRPKPLTARDLAGRVRKRVRNQAADGGEDSSRMRERTVGGVGWGAWWLSESGKGSDRRKWGSWPHHLTPGCFGPLPRKEGIGPEPLPISRGFGVSKLQHRGAKRQDRL